MQQPTKGRSWFARHKILSAILGVVVLIVIVVAAIGGSSNKATTTTAGATGSSANTSGSTPGSTANTTTTASTAGSTTTTTAATTTTTTSPKRSVSGKLTTLGAGDFTVGQDIPAGLYNVIAGAGQSGNFIVNGPDTYDEILGSADGMGVPEVRARLRSGDKIQLSGLSSVTFTPVTSPYVTSVKTTNLYAGTWIVGQDIAPGRYVATPGAGQSGNFIIDAQGVDEILGSADGMGVPNVTVTIHKGDVIEISGIAQVTMTPKAA